MLLKRHLLTERGWPESTLLITVVRDENNEGHAVLTVRTDRGDLVLDNKRREILTWNATATPSSSSSRSGIRLYGSRSWRRTNRRRRPLPRRIATKEFAARFSRDKAR